MGKGLGEEGPRGPLPQGSELAQDGGGRRGASDFLEHTHTHTHSRKFDWLCVAVFSANDIVLIVSK
jgi:hypothetical protein